MDFLQSISQHRIAPPPVSGTETAADLIDRAFLSYNAGRLRELCQVFARKMLEPDCTVGLTLAGALTPAALPGFAQGVGAPHAERGLERPGLRVREEPFEEPDALFERPYMAEPESGTADGEAIKTPRVSRPRSRRRCERATEPRDRAEGGPSRGTRLAFACLRGGGGK